MALFQEQGEADPSLTKGQWSLDLDLEVNMGHRSRYRPVALAPSITLGITDRLAIGIVNGARNRGLVTSGEGICIKHCEDRLRGLELQGLIHIVRASRWSVGTRIALGLRRNSPLQTFARLGVYTSWQSRFFDITSDPWIKVGLNGVQHGNAHSANVPIRLILKRWPVRPYLMTGFEGIIDDFVERVDVPLAAGVVFKGLNAPIELGVQFGFRSVLGPQNTPKTKDFLLWWRIKGKTDYPQQPIKNN